MIAEIQSFANNFGLQVGSLTDILAILVVILVPILGFVGKGLYWKIFKPKLKRINTQPEILDLHFQGRVDYLKSIRGYLTKAKFLRRKRTIVLKGMGGIGKTSLALKFVEKYRRQYGHVIWINSDTTETIKASLRFAQATLAQSGYSEFSSGEELSLRALRAYRKPTLVILDNLDNPPVGLDLLGQTENAHTIVTTRAANWPFDFEVREILVLSEEAAIEFLHSATGLQDPRGARQLSSKLGHLPLALNHAAYTILENGIHSYDEYSNQISQYLDYVPDLSHYNRSVYATFMVALNSCDVDEIRGNWQILPIGFLDPDNIRVEVLQALYNEFDIDISPERLLRQLQKRSIVSELPDGRFQIHRVIQDVIRSTMTDYEINRFVVGFSAVINKILPKSVADYRKFEHTKSVLEGIDYISKLKIPVTKSLVDLLLVSGGANLQWGNIEEAKRHISLAQEFDPLNKEEEFLLLRAQMSRGSLAQVEQDYDLSISIFEHCVDQFADRTASLPEKERLNIESTLYNNLGRSYQFLAQRTNRSELYFKASTALTRALNLSVAAEGEGTSIHGQRLNNCAMLQLAAGETAAALEQIREAVQITETAVGKKNPTYGIRLRNLAHIQVRNGLFEEALKNVTEAWTLLERQLAKQPARRTVVLITYAEAAHFAGAKEEEKFAIDKLMAIVRHENFDVGIDAKKALFRFYRQNGIYHTLSKAWLIFRLKGFGKNTLQT